MPDVPDWLKFLIPKPASCPLVRIGGDSDGAYLVPDDLNGVTACFSPGVANFKSFEDELLDKYNIRSHMVDFSSDPHKFATPLRPGLQTFRKLWLDDRTAENSITLDQWVSEEESGTHDLILQMDIEGAEYRTLMGVTQQLLRRFRVIVLELHGLSVQHNTRFIEDTVSPLTTRLDQDFVCVHAHPNNAGGSERLDGFGVEVPRVLEVTLLRRDRLVPVPDTHKISPMIPHPLDLPVNSSNFAPLILTEDWCPGNRRCSASRERSWGIYGEFSGACIDSLLQRVTILEIENVRLRRRLDELSVLSRSTRLVRRIRHFFFR